MPMPIALGFPSGERARFPKGECNSPLPFSAKMNGIGAEAHADRFGTKYRRAHDEPRASALNPPEPHLPPFPAGNHRAAAFPFPLVKSPKTH
jgi:hypothetical protein